MPIMYYAYEPFTGQSGEEIPAFVIYVDGEPVAFTNENQSRETQEQFARSILAGHLVLMHMAAETGDAH